jgi:hypothetical protein
MCNKYNQWMHNEYILFYWLYLLHIDYIATDRMYLLNIYYISIE